MSKDEFVEKIDISSQKILHGVKKLQEAYNKNAEANFNSIRSTIDANAQKLDLVVKRQQEVV